MINNNRFRLYLEMFKLKIVLPVSLTGFTGFFLIDPSFSAKSFLVTTGIIFMAIAASVINQLQEIETDKKMERTMSRPLPSGKISVVSAWLVAIIFLIAGSIIIRYNGNNAAMIVSLFTVFWYNGVYTVLKRVTSLAVIPGALTGAMPPLIGWLAAGGDPFDPRITIIQLFFFTGQIPHFWLLLLKYGDQYKKADFPVLTAFLSYHSVKRLIFITLLISVLSAILMSIGGIIINNMMISLIIVLSAGLMIVFYIFLKENNDQKKISRYSAILNSYYLVIMFLLISDRVIASI
ncbi:MAG TPA: protoheme IX farnesyltransferase [Bacteroidales bacterium]|nr:protoheme IX farnesyltransferase [Bacteroidales bacterium]